jgi:hypothetical protein
MLIFLLSNLTHQAISNGKKPLAENMLSNMLTQFNKPQMEVILTKPFGAGYLDMLVIKLDSSGNILDCDLTTYVKGKERSL